MRKPSKPLFLALTLVVLVIAVPGFELLRFGGAFRAVEPRFDGECRDIALAGSSEDIQVDRDRGIAYLSLLDRDTRTSAASGNGTVMLLDLNIAEPAPRAAMSYDPQGFRPHGLSLLKQPGQPARLFAISHPAHGVHAVEISEQDTGGSFVPRETVRDPAFVNPNAVAAVGPKQFYLVNDRPAQGKWRERLDMLTRAGKATLVFHDGEKARVLVDDLAWPAGLALSPDGAHLYVGEALAKSLRVYRRQSDGTLTLERTVALDASPDNLSVDADGLVWIATHPRLLRFLAHMRDPAERAPTQVLRFDPRRPDAGAVQVFADDGARISAGTVAAPWRDEFLVGALLDKKVLICKPNP